MGLLCKQEFYSTLQDETVLIDYSCNYTSRESNGKDVRGKNLQTFWPNPGPTSVSYDLEYNAG